MLKRLLSLLCRDDARTTIKPTKPAESPAYPLGWWLCTHADDWAIHAGFIPGRHYYCHRMHETGSLRLAPERAGNWAPYWVPAENRFCYAPEDMAFAYVGVFSVFAPTDPPRRPD